MPGWSAAQAVSAASAVAHSYISYVGGKNAPGGKIRAMLFMPANIWPRTSPPGALDTGGLGAWCGAIIGAIGAAALSRPGRRFRMT